MMSTVSTHVNNTNPDMALNHIQATQAIDEGCIKLEELVLITKPALGGSGPGDGGMEMCVHLHDEIQVANCIEKTVDDTPLTCYCGAASPYNKVTFGDPLCKKVNKPHLHIRST